MTPVAGVLDSGPLAGYGWGIIGGMGRVRSGELRDMVIEVLGADAVPLEMLRARLGAPWAERRGGGRDELDRLLRLDASFTEVSDGLVFVPALVKGTVWTVWVDPHDGAEGFVRMHPGLSALGWWLIGGDVELVDAAGHHLGVLETDGWMLDDRDTDVVLGPGGWLDGLLGRWARVEVVDGALCWSALDAAPVPTLAQVAAIRAGFDRAVRGDVESRRSFDLSPLPDGLRFSSGDDPIHEALFADRRAFRDDPIPPLTDLYSAAGLVERDAIIAEDGFDWDALRTWQTRNRLAISYGLDSAQVEALAGLLAAYDKATGADGEPVAEGSTAGALDDGDVAAVLWSELGRRGARLDDLRQFAGALPATDPATIGAVWLQARLLDASGDTAAAVGTLEASVAARCDHRPALVDLAGFRADRGDAVGALRLLAQAGIGQPDADVDDELSDAELLRDEVEGFATHRPRPTARRNDPCPCGSGRKYKACHLGRETHSLDDRASWLYLKAQRFLANRHPEAVAELAAQIVDEIDQRKLFEDLLDAPFIADVVLHEDGVFGEFLAARDGLLPDDEALLAAQWAMVDRGVFEILDVRPSGLELRDVARGERISVVNTHPSDRTRPGMLLVGRPLPVGDTHRAFSGFMNVPHGHGDTMLAAIDTGDSDAVADALAAILAPPQLANTDGHHLVAHTMIWRVPEPSVVGDALVAAGLHADDDHHWTLVRDSPNQDNTVIAGVGLDRDELTIEVNSAERAAELEALIGAALPDAEFVDVDARAFEAPADGSAGTPRSGGIDINDPAIRAVLADHIAGMERRWLDESIPALGGRTPRQAADDPIGREELTRLLASFPVPADGAIGVMDPDRLRAALGL